MFELLFKYPRSAWERGTLEFTASWPDWLLPALVTAGMAAVAVAFLAGRRRWRATRLAAIAALQLAMLAAVLVVLYQPALVTDRLREGDNELALLLDTSASMGYGADERRIHTGRAALERAGAGSAMGLRRYGFDAAARRLESFAGADPAGERSDLANAVTTVLREARSLPLAAVIVASDGADTAGGISADELAEIAGFGVPVHAVAVGRERMPEDLELGAPRLPARVLPDSTVAARVTVRHDGPGEARLKVYDGDELLAASTVTLADGATATLAELEFRMDVEGPHTLEFVLDPADGETERRNNRRTALVNVEPASYSMLYYEGEPRWEYKFLRRAVGDDETLRLASLLRVSPNKFYRQGLAGPEELANGFPTSRAELFAYDALIIGSVEAALLSPEQQQMVADFVGDRGGSLLLLAGPRGLGDGGWGQTPVSPVLPVRLPDPDRATFSRRRAQAVLTPQGITSRLLRLVADPDENARAWAALPEIANYQVTGELRPAATLLLEAETDAGRVPLLVSQPYGRGVGYVLATSGTWRWQMSMPVEDLSHETFWRQLLRSMVASAPRRVTLDAEARPGGEGIVLRAEFRDEEHGPLAAADVSAVVARADGETLTVPLLPSEAEPGVHRARVDPGASGVYFVEAVASRDGEPLATARTSVSYTTGEAEHFGIRQNRGVLERLAQATGGRVFEPDDLDALPDLLRYESAGITEREFRPVWDMPALFLLLLLLKSAEWLLRRTWNTI